MILETQKLLATEGLTSLDKLGIEKTFNKENSLVILNYSQIDSPKFHPVVRECRGLCLEVDSWKVVGAGFKRFYNWLEDQENQSKFDWNNFSAEEKEDGSYISVSCYGGQWQLRTRGSFGEAQPSMGYWL